MAASWLDVQGADRGGGRAPCPRTRRKHTWCPHTDTSGTRAGPAPSRTCGDVVIPEAAAGRRPAVRWGPGSSCSPGRASAGWFRDTCGGKRDEGGTGDKPQDSKSDLVSPPALCPGWIGPFAGGLWAARVTREAPQKPPRGAASGFPCGSRPRGAARGPTQQQRRVCFPSVGGAPAPVSQSAAALRLPPLLPPAARGLRAACCVGGRSHRRAARAPRCRCRSRPCAAASGRRGTACRGRPLGRSASPGRARGALARSDVCVWASSSLGSERPVSGSIVFQVPVAAGRAQRALGTGGGVRGPGRGLVPG